MPVGAPDGSGWIGGGKFVGTHDSDEGGTDANGNKETRSCSSPDLRTKERSERVSVGHNGQDASTYLDPHPPHEPLLALLVRLLTIFDLLDLRGRGRPARFLDEVLDEGQEDRDDDTRFQRLPEDDEEQGYREQPRHLGLCEDLKVQDDQISSHFFREAQNTHNCRSNEWYGKSDRKV